MPEIIKKTELEELKKHNLKKYKDDADILKIMEMFLRKFLKKELEEVTGKKT